VILSFHDFRFTWRWRSVTDFFFRMVHARLGHVTNVGVMVIMQIPCPTCHRELEHRMSKKQKPYFVCDFCGVQIFFRLQEGIERLEASLTKAIIEDDFVLCRSCQVAVRRSKRKVSKPVFEARGIYCPECHGLLLRAEALG
jgi:ssDNA-binding Zn-finger/Zn-ribbon topoisomerase 1